MASKEATDDAKVTKLSESTPAVRTIYADGGQNVEFTHAQLPDVSRPEALAAGPTDWLVEPSKSKKVSPVVKIAAAKASAHATTLAKAKAPSASAADKNDRTSSIKKPDAPKSQAAL